MEEKNYEEYNLLKSGYFLLEDASDNYIEYTCIHYFKSEDELKDYIEYEFKCDFGSVVATYSLSELMEGQQYEVGHRQGMHRSTVYITLVHGENLRTLFNFIGNTEAKMKSGKTVLISDLLERAQYTDEIAEIIEYFNWIQDNIW